MEYTRHRGYEKLSTNHVDTDAAEHGRAGYEEGEKQPQPASRDASKNKIPKSVSTSPVKPGLRSMSPATNVSQHSKQVSASDRKPVNTLLGRAWEGYCRGLETHPLLVKSLTSFTGFFIADQLAQVVTGVYLDYKRLCRMLLFALTIHGPLCHYWYTMLDNVVYPSSPKSTPAILLKIVLDQLLFAPVFLVVFWFSIKALEGRPEDAYEMCFNKLYPTLIVSYMLWPAAHIINFRYIPSSQRLLYINIVTVFWTTYLSWSAADTNVEVSID
mmetsp:Transcript_16102/g.44874  ORF Transcript_16102/g.44874 Transcript_16102/m.44874 type:complete len:271 (+) Transcript_16102:239-1051(+)|eukprot:CAMPEP_0117673014 /NCGR_PEP_ID=MMETSP0804-20121206/14237_1 /TAXON_ID=1074897 /ORGANISM="Tetraselmis astigmatica, Strain CCMP880" /LENGTH=270 /DNA_ID=CAMNT_0005481705 /DNA_START=130 /DNA_END=942 /DNA_ORIENTATION=+